MWYPVDCHKGTNIFEELSASICPEDSDSMLLQNNQTTWYHMPEDSLNVHCWEPQIS